MSEECPTIIDESRFAGTSSVSGSITSRGTSDEVRSEPPKRTNIKTYGDTYGVGKT